MYVHRNVKRSFRVLQLSITLTSPCYEHPGRPHFVLEKWVFQGYTLFFLFWLKDIDCGYLIDPPH